MVAEKPSPEDALRGAKSYRPNLPRHERLTNWDKRAKIIFNGKPLKYDSIYISILPQTDWKLSIVIKKCCGNAVQRNMYRRKIREAFRLCKPHCRQPVAVAITVFKKPDNLQVNTLSQFLINHIKSQLE
ncbi:MAG TPA: ribonuclease P protein component [Candidatus Marinimicrobia bacterium]|nr:ribonuclease P protein component [Candidatus Neomarinimicrobiota bacterium]HRU91812.1 ribonuclease P protein component [Candidatus Neomarinimicrobiota bacterium]